MAAEERESTGGTRSAFFELVTTRPVAIMMMFLAIAVFGVVSLSKLHLDLLPEISYPTLTVRTGYPGAAPEDVEDRISERIQETLSTLPHIVRSTSLSRAEVSDVVLDFEWGTSMAFAVQDVRDRLDSVVLPRDAERPLILRYDPNLDPILRVGVTLPEGSKAFGGDRERELIHLRWLAEKRIKRELETIPGIAAVQVRGGLQEEIRIRVDPFRMAAQNLDPATLGTRLAQENLNASGGLIREGSSEYLVRTLNEFRDVAEIENLALVRRGNAVIRIKDVGTVERTHAEREVVTRIADHEAVEIAIYREAGANIVSLADAVKARIFGTPEQQQRAKMQQDAGGGNLAFSERENLPQLAWTMRKEAHFEPLSDQSTFIRSAIDDVKSSAWLGALLAMVVIWFALRRLPPTLIIGISIPVSVVVTFAAMYSSGVTLNIMSLGGLALGIGMLVDNSIVVLESIAKCREEGDSLLAAAVRGTREVAGAITGSTLTTVAVFAPIVFVKGIAGRIFGDQALTVVSSLLVSLIVALVLIPMLASREWLFGDRREETAPSRPPSPVAGFQRTWAGIVPSLLRFKGRVWLWLFGGAVRVHGLQRNSRFSLFGTLLWPFHWAHDKLWGLIERAYPRVLGAALARPWTVLFFVACLAGWSFLRVRHLGLDLLPEVHQGEFTAYVGLPVGTPLETTDTVLRKLEARVREIPGVELTALTVGVEKDTLTREIEGKHTGRLSVRLVQGKANQVEEERVVAATRKLIADDPAVRSVDIKRSTPFALEAPVEVEVLGYDLDEITKVAREVRERLERIPGLSDVRTTLRPGHPEARVSFDRDKILEYGLDLNAIATLVRDQVQGNVSTRFVQGDERIDVRVIGDEVLLSSLDRVLSLEVNPLSDKPVPLSSVAHVETVEGPAEIRRIGNTRAVVVSASTGGLDLGGTADAIEKALADLRTPDEVALQIGGQKREMEEAQSSMRFALLLALFLVYAVMACQFESLVQPLIVMFTAPLAAVGVLFALDLLDIPLSVIVFIGLILLAGIVVNNAIVLIDRVNQTRARGFSVREALLEAAATRLRPIYMTTATTVLGLLPMTGWLASLPGIGALGTGEGAELREPLAVTVVAGLTSATLLTLVVIPCIYLVMLRHQDARRIA
ncbi:MAG: efflux RND transporter permease subunit [Planctomycetes bacterium]|nr:efflux RND transporter permease subunit [Planctomycetota bacterium]